MRTALHCSLFRLNRGGTEECNGLVAAEFSAPLRAQTGMPGFSEEVLF